jgi:integrase
LAAQGLPTLQRTPPPTWSANPALALEAWLKGSKIARSPVFRSVDQWGNLGTKPLTPQAVNLILKKRIAMARLDPRLFSAHGLRSGYLTEAARQGAPLPEAMVESQHKSVQRAARYYMTPNEGPAGEQG